MNIQQFLQIVLDKRELLGKPTEEFGTGCPLRVVLCDHWKEPCADYWRELFAGLAFDEEPINPDPEVAAGILDMPEPFTGSIADTWDCGKFYSDVEDAAEWSYEFAGFLVSVTLREWHHALPPATG